MFAIPNTPSAPRKLSQIKLSFPATLEDLKDDLLAEVIAEVDCDDSVGDRNGQQSPSPRDKGEDEVGASAAAT